MKLILKIRKRLSSISAFYFGLLYLALIPVYAWRYYTLPNQFYQSTSNLEKLTTGFQKEDLLEDEITNDFGETIANNFIKWSNRNYIVTCRNDTFYDPISTYPADGAKVKLNGSELTVPILIPIKQNECVSLPIKMNINSIYELHAGSDTAERIVTIDTLSSFFLKDYLDSSTLGYNYKILFPRNPEDRYRGTEIMIPIDIKLQQKINSLSFGLNGIANSKDYWNMFYLSAVTITTLGFGDFVPISKKARLWVSSEAILGVIVIGLFLNSLTKNLGKSV